MRKVRRRRKNVDDDDDDDGYDDSKRYRALNVPTKMCESVEQQADK